MIKKIKIKYQDGVEQVEKIKVGDWIDLRCAETTPIQKGDFKYIPLGVAMQLPKGYEALLVPRSSTFKKYKILQVNSPGVIDSSYCGDDDWWCMPIYATEDTIIVKNERIAQFRIIKSMPKIQFVVVDKLFGKNRGGFGSTGRN